MARVQVPLPSRQWVSAQNLTHCFGVIDVQMATIRLVMSAGGMTNTLLTLVWCTQHSLYISDMDKHKKSLESAIDIIGRVVTYMETTVHRTNELQSINQTSVSNGQQGTISAKTLNSVKMIRAELSYLCEILMDINPDYLPHIEMTSMLTK